MLVDAAPTTVPPPGQDAVGAQGLCSVVTTPLQPWGSSQESLWDCDVLGLQRERWFPGIPETLRAQLQPCCVPSPGNGPSWPAGAAREGFAPPTKRSRGPAGGSR